MREKNLELKRIVKILLQVLDKKFLEKDGDSMNQQEMLKKIVSTLSAKKAEDIEVLGIKDLTIVAEYFVIATASNVTQSKALADEVEFQLTEAGVKPTRAEGYNGANWILLDYSDIIVHIFYKETRQFYQLEKLWSDGEKVDISEFLE